MLLQSKKINMERKVAQGSLQMPNLALWEVFVHIFFEILRQQAVCFILLKQDSAFDKPDRLFGNKGDKNFSLSKFTKKKVIPFFS